MWLEMVCANSFSVGRNSVGPEHMDYGHEDCNIRVRAS